jgi:hypothetical protein
VGFALVLFLAHRQDPMTLAERFFSSAGAERTKRIAHNLLALSPATKGPQAYALLWQEEIPHPLRKLPRRKNASDETTTVYILYSGRVPEDARVLLQERLSCEVIPISTQRVAIALSEGTSPAVLREAQDRFATRDDPYDEAKPVDDPAWFHGRADILDRLSMALQQGQHVGLFGLRKVGKTSLIKQLRNRAQELPVVYIDCQAAGVVAADYFQLLLDRLRAEFTRLQIPHPPPSKKVSSFVEFREEFLQFHRLWIQAGRSGPFLLLLDELDQLFVDRRREGSEQLLGEYVRLLRPLRALAQEHRCWSPATVPR